MTATTVPRSLVWATDVDTLAPDRVVERRDGYLLIRSPSNPTFYWGNLLLFDEPPRPGDGREVGAAVRARVRRRAPSASTTPSPGTRPEEPPAPRRTSSSRAATSSTRASASSPKRTRCGRTSARTATSSSGRSIPLPVRTSSSWDAVLELQVAGRPEGHDEESFRAFARPRLDSRRALFRLGRGAWYVAIDPASGEVAASCGIVVTAGRGRFQVVDTALAHRRRGICSRLVVEAARHSAETHGAERFVIVADLGYHALGLYESLGFERREHVVGVCRWPRSG